MCVNSKYSSIILCAILTCISIGFCQNYNLQQFNTVRVAHEWYFGINIQNDLTDLYFKRVIKNGYNYVTFDPNFWWTSAQISSKTSEEAIYENVRNDIRSAVINANRFGLRVIPMISLSSRWAYNQWHPMEIATGKTLCAATYESTGWANFRAPSSEWTKFGSTRWSPDPDGIDIYLPRVLQAIKDGFEAAKVAYPLEFILLTHDEPFCGDRLLIGGVSRTDNSSLCYGVQWRNITNDPIDMAWINTKRSTESPSNAVAMLIANEAYRRTNQVSQVFGGKVKTMFFADMWDKGSNGGVDMQLFDGTWNINTAPTVFSLPGLTTTEAQFVKNNLVLVFWHFKTEQDHKYGACLADGYNFNEPFRKASENGFKFMYVGAVEPGGNPLWSKADQRLQAQVAISWFQIESFNYQANCLGYVAASWDASAYNPDPNVYNGYTTLETMAQNRRSGCLKSTNPFYPLYDWDVSFDPNKWYRIVFNHSGLCIRPTDGQTADNLQIEQSPINNNDQTQLWKFQKGDAPGFYFPINYNGKSLDVYGTASGSYVGTWSMHNGWNQQFRFEESPIPGNYFMVDLLSANLGINLTVDVERANTDAGAKVLAWTKKPTGYQNQIVQLIEVPDPNSWYKLTFLHSGQCMRPTNKQCGNNIQIEQFSNNDDTTQFWKFVNGTNGYLYPINANGKSLDIYGTALGSFAGTWDSHNGENQQFRFDVCAKPGYYYMIDNRSEKLGTNLTIDVQGASTTSGAKIFIWDKKTTNYENQVVKLEQVKALSPQGEISTGLNKDGRLYLFARGQDNNLYYKLQDVVNGSWPSTWEILGGPILGNIAVGISPVSDNNRIYVFSKCSENLLVYKYQLTPGQDIWSDWNVIGDYPINSNIIVGNYSETRGGDLIVFARSSIGDGIVWVRHKGASEGSTNPAAWYSLEVLLPNSGYSLGDKIALAQNEDQSISLIGYNKDTKTFLCCKQDPYTESFASSYWKEINTSVAYTGELVVAKNNNKCLELFTIKTESIYHCYQTAPSSTSWSAWEKINSGTGAYGQLAVAQRNDKCLEVFARGYRNIVSHTWYNGSSWSILEGVSNVAMSAPLKPIIAAKNANGLFSVFAINDQEPIQTKIMVTQQTSQSGNGIWDPWVKFMNWQ